MSSVTLDSVLAKVIKTNLRSRRNTSEVDKTCFNFFLSLIYKYFYIYMYYIYWHVSEESNELKWL